MGCLDESGHSTYSNNWNCVHTNRIAIVRLGAH